VPNPSSSSAPSASNRSNHSSHATGAGPGGGSNTLWPVVAVVAVLLLLLAAPPVAKQSRRRRRRRARSPGRAVHGAWRETVDRLVESGAPVAGRQSPAEVVAAAPRSVRADVRGLSAVYDRAGYAPEIAAPADARAAWQHADGATRTLRAGLSHWRRLVARLDPRPLWRS
jgi:hypothetical protein